MPDDTSSANPAALRAYASTGRRIDADLEVTAARLTSALAQFQATCTEYRIGLGPDLADDLRALARHAADDDVWVSRVADAFEAADRGTPVPAVTPAPSPAPEPLPTATPTPRAVDVGPSAGGDFLASRGVDATVEWLKANIEPRYAWRLVPQVVQVVERELTAVVSEDSQVVAYTLRETTSSLLSLSARRELLNAPAVAVNGFLKNALTGVPLVGGAVQGITDWVTEPDLSTGQRIGRIGVAAVTGTVIAVGVAALLPEEAVGAALVIGGGLAANALADLFVKPWVFGQLGLNPTRAGAPPVIAEPAPAPDLAATLVAP